MTLLERLDREAKHCDAQLSRKLCIGYYDQSLCDLRDLLESAAKEIRSLTTRSAQLGEKLQERHRFKRLLEKQNN